MQRSSQRSKITFSAGFAAIRLKNVHPLVIQSCSPCVKRPHELLLFSRARSLRLHVARPAPRPHICPRPHPRALWKPSTSFPLAKENDAFPRPSNFRPSARSDAFWQSRAIRDDLEIETAWHFFITTRPPTFSIIVVSLHLGSYVRGSIVNHLAASPFERLWSRVLHGGEASLASIPAAICALKKYIRTRHLIPTCINRILPHSRGGWGESIGLVMQTIQPPLVDCATV